MESYEVIVVNAKGETWEFFDKCKEIELYMYGRYFRLGSSESDLPGITNVFYLVESHYADQIIPRLGSGLIWARLATLEERSSLGLWAS